MFTNLQHSTLLQIADLVVGATREFVDYCIRNKPLGLGVECLKLVRNRFRGAPYSISGRGLIIPSNNPDLRRQVEKGIEENLCPAAIKVIQANSALIQPCANSGFTSEVTFSRN